MSAFGLGLSLSDRLALGKTEVYGMWFDPGHGYHVDTTSGVAKGNEPESLFAVMSGTHFGGGCCFDYGNSENTKLQPVHTGDYACGAMEAICESVLKSCPNQASTTRAQPSPSAHAAPWTAALMRVATRCAQTSAMRTGKGTRAPARRGRGSALT